MVTFRREDQGRVAAGEISVTFRLWRSARVKAGKTYQTGFGAVAVDEVRVVPAALISDEDAHLAGCSDVASVWRLAGEHTGTVVRPDTLLYRVQFRFLGERRGDAPAASLDLAAIIERLARMDRLSRRGPWTLAALRLIDAAPRAPARLLAAEMGWETRAFKANVRKLKRLGLTASHEVGYELTPLGRRALERALLVR